MGASPISARQRMSTLAPCPSRLPSLGRDMGAGSVANSRRMAAASSSMPCTSGRHFFQRGRWHGRQPVRHQLHGNGLGRSEEHTSELQSPCNLVCRLLLEKKKEDRGPSDLQGPNGADLYASVAQLQSLSCTTRSNRASRLYRSCDLSKIYQASV